MVPVTDIPRSIYFMLAVIAPTTPSLKAGERQEHGEPQPLEDPLTILVQPRGGMGRGRCLLHYLES